MKLRKRGFTGAIINDVTQREAENRDLARTAAAEGFVLLKNENHVLPIEKGSRIGLYGAGAVATIKGGTGSGDVNERDCITIRQGLENAGYELTSKVWLDSYAELYHQARLDWRAKIFRIMEDTGSIFFDTYSANPFRMPGGDAIDTETAKADGADTAIFVLSRIAGENADRRDEEGDYFITKAEKALLAQITEAYQNVVLVINTGGLIDLSFADEFSNIRAILQYVQAGQEGGSAFADVISGDVTPSGKMTDTWALAYQDYPNASFFSYKSGDVYKEEYKEGIYVGYRYFDTFQIPVRYCFGYGLSYTEFAVQAGILSVTGLTERCGEGKLDCDAAALTEQSGKGKLDGDAAAGLSGTEPMVSLEVSVKNIGAEYEGKEVVQIYVSCPQGRLPKEFRRLACFGKTNLLKPGETQKMKLSFALYQMASYSEELAAWILEKGTYGIWLGASLENAELAGSVILDEDAVMVQCEHICECREELEELSPDAGKLRLREKAWLAEAAKLQCVMLKAADIMTETIDYERTGSSVSEAADEVVKYLALDQLVNLATGDINSAQSEVGAAGQTVPGAAAETTHTAEDDPWNVASIVLADGPAGLRLKQSYQVCEGQIEAGSVVDVMDGGFFAPETEKHGVTYYQYCTAIPVGTLLAQTWNVELIKEVGEMIGHEMNLFEITLWLAPGMNIHRNPLCGRNFEYYSEDPLLSGIMASAMTLGVQKVPGCGTTIKHFACNNQEDNRLDSNSVISERALREIYLKGFEIAVKNAQPMSIMTSYNMINGIHAANSYDLCTRVARGEWGFAGAIMTDWLTTVCTKVGESTASGCLRAGNDMVMPGQPSDHKNIREELAQGTLDIAQLTACVRNTVNLILQSNQYEDAVSYLDQFEGLDTYMKTEQ